MGKERTKPSGNDGSVSALKERDKESQSDTERQGRRREKMVKDNALMDSLYKTLLLLFSLVPVSLCTHSQCLARAKALQLMISLSNSRPHCSIEVRGDVETVGDVGKNDRAKE